MFILRQTSVKMAVLLHKQAKVPFIMIVAVGPFDNTTKQSFFFVAVLLPTVKKMRALLTSDITIFLRSSTVFVFFDICLLLLKSSVTEIPFPLKILEDVVCLRIFSLSLTLLKVATIGLT